MNKRKKLIITSIVTLIVILCTASLTQRKIEMREKKRDKLIENSVKEQLKTIPPRKESPSKEFKDSNGKVKNEESNKYSIQIERVIELEKKVLPKLKEKKELERLLSNRKLIDDSFSKIEDFKIEDSENFQSNQDERMDAVFFITKSMAWHSNPQLKVVVTKAKKYILKDRFDEIQEIKMRQSVAADKIEIFSELKDNHFKEAIEVEENNRSDRNAKLFRFANNFYKLDSKRRLK